MGFSSFCSLLLASCPFFDSTLLFWTHTLKTGTFFDWLSRCWKSGDVFCSRIVNGNVWTSGRMGRGDRSNTTANIFVGDWLQCPKPEGVSFDPDTLFKNSSVTNKIEFASFCLRKMKEIGAVIDKLGMRGKWPSLFRTFGSATDAPNTQTNGFHPRHNASRGSPRIWRSVQAFSWTYWCSSTSAEWMSCEEQFCRIKLHWLLSSIRCLTAFCEVDLIVLET